MHSRLVATRVERGRSGDPRQMRAPLRCAVVLAVACVLPPALAQAQVPFDRRDEFVKRVPDFRARQKASYGALEALVGEVERREQRGEKAVCAHQILNEVEWLIAYTTDFPRIAARLDAAREALAAPDPGDAPDAADGALGQCATEWFFKLDFSYDHFAEAGTSGRPAEVAPHFLDRINSPEALSAHLLGLQISDIAATGIDHRRELNETTADIMRLILRDWPPGYSWRPELKATLKDLLLNRMRDPATGYWGAWYKTGDGLVKTVDLSLTFHIVSYLGGDVGGWPALIDTTLAIKGERYPNGWQSTVGYDNHHDMDVVELFRLGWPNASAEQRVAIAREIALMLDWCLTKSVQPDGSFKISPEDESIETSFYFGTSFLVRAGYFDKARRFWTDRDFPEAPALRAKLIAQMTARLHEGAGAEGGYYYRNALKQLSVTAAQ